MASKVEISWGLSAAVVPRTRNRDKRNFVGAQVVPDTDRHLALDAQYPSTHRTQCLGHG